MIIRGSCLSGLQALLIFFYNPQQPIDPFSGILSSGPRLFLQSSATDRPFFRNPQLGTRTFFVILSNRSTLFPESSARDPGFFYNPQQPIDSFSGILSSGPRLFLQSSATDRLFFRNPQLGTRTFFVILSYRAGLPGFAAPPFCFPKIRARKTRIRTGRAAPPLPGPEQPVSASNPGA